MNNNNNYLVTEKTGHLLIRFSVPCILSLLISALYNIVDQIFIGNSSVGAIGNTATTIVFPLTCIALAFALMLGDGAAAFMSLCMGKKDNESVGISVGNAITIGVIISILFLFICIPLLNNILSLFGAKTALALEKSYEYGFIILFGIPFYIMGTIFNSIIRADGNPQFAMLSMILGAVCNIILDAVFILGLNMGLTGAALATIIGQILSFVISVIFIIKAKCYKLKISDFIIEKNIILDVLKLGLSSFLTQISIVIISVVSMNVLAKYGALSKYGSDDPQAIIGVSMKVFTIFVNIAVGIAAGAQPIVGFNYGANRLDRVKDLYKKIIISIIIIGVIATLIFELAPEFVIGLFGSNSLNPENYKEFGVLTIRIYLCLIIFTLVEKGTAIFLQSIGKPYKAMILSLTRDVIVFVPATIIMPIFIGIEGVLWAAPIADVIGIILCIIFIIIEMKKLNINNID